MKVINFFGGPGISKSTTSAGLFYQLKLKGINCELVTERAKDLVWEERTICLKDQVSILAAQNRKLERLRDKVEYAIVDSPLLLGMVYLRDLEIYYKNLEPLALEIFNSYDNINFLLERVKPYNSVGRLQTEQESIEKDDQIKNFLIENNVEFHQCRGDETAVDFILQSIL